MPNAPSLGSEMTPLYLRKLSNLCDFYVWFLTAIHDISSDIHSDFQVNLNDLAIIKTFIAELKMGNYDKVNMSSESINELHEVIARIVYNGTSIGSLSNTHIFRHKKIGDRRISIINYHLPAEVRAKIKSFHSQINTFFTNFYRDMFLSTSTMTNFSQSTCGFVAGKSYLDHAKAHLQSKTIVSIDIKKFYESIKLKNIMENSLFIRSLTTSANLHNIDSHNTVVTGMITFCSSILFSMSNYMTHNGVVPTGAHYSPSYSNFIFAPIDEAILKTISEVNPVIIYTRYADDIAVSTPVLSIEGTYVLSMDVIRRIESIVNSFTFYLKYEKTKIMGPKQRKIIAGLTIDQSDPLNPKLSIGTQKKLELQALYSGKKFSELTDSEKGTLNWVHQVNISQYNFVISQMNAE